MSFKDDREEAERIARRNAKIQKMLKKAEPGIAKAKPDAPKAETTVEPPVQLTPALPPPAPAPCRLVPPLRPWEKIGAFGRREQWRPTTRAEQEALQEEHFIKSQRLQDEAHRAKVEAAKREHETESARLTKQREHERRTGLRPMGRDMTCTLDEARRRGYLDSQQVGTSDDSSSKPPYNPHDNRGNLMRRFGA
jgi:hypothetical protein